MINAHTPKPTLYDRIDDEGDGNREKSGDDKGLCCSVSRNFDPEISDGGIAKEHKKCVKRQTGDCHHYSQNRQYAGSFADEDEDLTEKGQQQLFDLETHDQLLD